MPSTFSNIEAKWQKTRDRINQMATQYKYDLDLPHTLQLTTVNSIRKEIKTLSSLIQVKHESLSKSLQDKQIKKFIQQRCDDYYDNQKHMINSFLERNRRSIVIDRVLQSINDQKVLVTDPYEIKRLTNLHFQQCPGGVHTPKVIPDQWKLQYEPKSDIDANIYLHLMSPISIQEWNETLKFLPLGKAAGPSGITNEMIKHLGAKMQKAIIFLINSCLRLNDIPTAWREAYVYPIPKPKDWECDLNNTRPITLLETIRKAMVRILNNRISKIFVQHHILKGN